MVKIKKKSFTSRHLSIKSWNCVVILSLEAMVGRPFCAMSQRARRGASVMYGGSPSFISIAIIPRLQISTFFPQCFRFTTCSTIIYLAVQSYTLQRYTVCSQDYSAAKCCTIIYIVIALQLCTYLYNYMQLYKYKLKSHLFTISCKIK